MDFPFLGFQFASHFENATPRMTSQQCNLIETLMWKCNAFWIYVIVIHVFVVSNSMINGDNEPRVLRTRL